MHQRSVCETPTVKRHYNQPWHPYRPIRCCTPAAVLGGKYSSANSLRVATYPTAHTSGSLTIRNNWVLRATRLPTTPSNVTAETQQAFVCKLCHGVGDAHGSVAEVFVCPVDLCHGWIVGSNLFSTTHTSAQCPSYVQTRIRTVGGYRYVVVGVCIVSESLVMGCARVTYHIFARTPGIIHNYNHTHSHSQACLYEKHVDITCFIWPATLLQKRRSDRA